MSGEGSSNRNRRGQSEVLAVVLLLGLTIISAMTVVAAGSSILTSLEGQSQTEQDRTEMQSIAHNIDTAVYSDGSFSVSELDGEYDLRPGANVTISFDGTTTHTYNTGQLVHGDFVYEGGMIVDDGRLISTPDVSLAPDSTMIQIPSLPYEDESDFDGQLRHTKTETPVPDLVTSLEILIQSEYYDQWYDFFSEKPIEVTKNDTTRTVRIAWDLSPEGIQQALNLGMSDGSSFNLNELPKTSISSYIDDPAHERHNATMNAKTGDGGNLGGDLTVKGDFYYHGERPNTNSNNFDVSGAVEPIDAIETLSTDELMIDPKTPNYDAGDGDLRGGTYYTDDLVLTDDLAVTSRNVLVVDGDLTIDDGELEVFGALDVYVHGDLILNDEATVKTADPYESKRVSFFVRDDVEVNGVQNSDPSANPEITGLIHGSNSTLDLYGVISVYGSITIDGVVIDHQQFDELYVRYDERLEGESPYANDRVDIEYGDRFADFDGIVYDEEYPDFQRSYTEDVLVKGKASASNVNFQNLAVEDDLEIEGGVVDGGELWIDGDANITGEVNMNNQPDLFVSGDATITGGTYTDLYVMGDLEVRGNANIHGEVHVLGDLTLDSEPIDGDLYVGGNAEVNSTVQGDEAHVMGDLTCNGGIVTADVYTADGSDPVDCGSTSEGTATRPRIPPHLLPAPGSISTPDLIGDIHYFDIRVSHLKLE